MDLITRQPYRHFELTLEWRVARGGNSGILSRVTEALPHAWQSGLDMQLLDDAHHPDGQTPETAAGALYGLIAPRRAMPLVSTTHSASSATALRSAERGALS